MAGSHGGGFKRTEYVDGRPQPASPWDEAEQRRRSAEIRARLKRQARAYLHKRGKA